MANKTNRNKSFTTANGSENKGMLSFLPSAVGAKAQNSSGAFTLIELLVVIAIIGLLASAVLASLSSARESARDARRVSDFDQLRTAINMYQNDHGGSYPGGAGTYQVSDNCSSTSLYQDLVDGGYLNSMPTDPAQSVTGCSGGSTGPLNDNDAFFYSWDGSNNGGDVCFGINNFESSDDAGNLQDMNQQSDTSFGGNANLDSATFVYCFEDTSYY